ncbi:hypothetical protein [Lichenibacterium dinghuense]|uniref:hypothetical protein n=1 Tax=Lichenibacterium dinghuense TaxID=2895977 RepID=UPI001F1D0604|nr:hypothetical protein [Lichenibacterium sp. 6Y81]
MTDPQAVALFTIAAGSAVGALLMATAADEATQDRSRAAHRAVLQQPLRRRPAWVRPVAFRCTSFAFLVGMTASGLVLICAPF